MKNVFMAIKRCFVTFRIWISFIKPMTGLMASSFVLARKLASYSVPMGSYDYHDRNQDVMAAFTRNHHDKEDTNN